MAGCCLKLFGVITLGLAILFGLVWQKINTVPDIPDIKSQYWGPGEPKPDDKSIRPFKINISEDVLIDLKTRLKNTKLVKPLEGIEFQYGMNSNYLKKILEFWQTKYDWRKREIYLNKFPQFKTQISGLDIHFLHIKPDAAKAKGKKIIPMLLLHGWPGSIREFYELIPLLKNSNSKDYELEIIAPSLPGYGFSEGASKPGLGAAQVAVIFKDLMNKLGHQKFLIQGGDWGSIIGASLSVLFPENVIAYHSNFCMANNLKARMQSIISIFIPSLFIEEYQQEEYPNWFSNIILESGYMHIQATKPDTVGVALSNSPAGLAAYILEKFSTWTNKAWKDLPDGGLTNYDMSALIDNVMIYWVTNSITTSVRLYAETFSAKYRAHRIDEIPITVPTGCARFSNELVYLSDSMLKTQYLDLVTLTYHEKGGHFAAFEEPNLLAQDILNFVQKLRTRRTAKEKTVEL